MLPKLIVPPPGPKALALIERDKKIMSPSYTRDYPFVMESGEGSIVHDPDGNAFLDFAAGIAVCSTGYRHPHVAQAIKDQVDKFLHMSGTDFYYGTQVALAERLVESMPIQGDKKVFFTNSGAEAIEAAFKLARFHTKRSQAITFFGGFHGRTMGALSLTASKTQQRKRFMPLVPGVSNVHFGYCYRCPYHLEFPSCDVHCMKFIEKVLFKHTVDPNDVAMILLEPVQGEGGYVVPPREVVEAVADICRRHGILLVVDEVQSGMGRTGKMFAIEHFAGVEPDIVCLAKGIASGMPLGAIVTKADVMSWEYGSHASTFGGNPVACAAAVATLDLLEGKVEAPNGSLIENARLMGDHLMKRLGDLKQRHRAIGDIRGLGLMVGAEVVSPRDGRTPDAELRNAILMEAFKEGLLILGCGPNTLRFAPPLVISKEQVDWGVDCLDRVFARHASA